MHVVSVISRHIDKLSKTYMMAAMEVLRYMKRTKNVDVKYEIENEVKLIGYSDND